MACAISKLLMLGIVAFIVLVAQVAFAATEELGNGFFHHGVATPVSNHRGTVATVDGEGRDVVLVWLFDHRGGYALLMIDAETGKADEIPMPFPPGGDCPYSSILSTKNKFYTHFNSYFCEFDPAKRAFTFSEKTAPQMAMGMTEDDNGVIWSVTYPSSGVVSFDPATRTFKDYGHVHKENWAQYQRYVAADDAGWVYFGVGNTASQIIAFDPRTGEGKPMLSEAERLTASGVVVPDVNGKVYGHNGAGADDGWYEFCKGEGKKVDPSVRGGDKPIITSSQSLFYTQFPDGKVLKTCDLVNRVLVVENAAGEAKQMKFDYTSEGAHIMGIAIAPDGTVCGGTAFPMRFFIYNPKTDTWANHAAYCQCNTVVRQGDRFFVGGYGGGYITEWDPTQPWVDTVKDKQGCNPLFLTDCAPTINRPHDLLAHPDGKTLVLAGTPGYGYTGGGLLFWDRETKTRVLLEHTDILPEHSTLSLVALPDGKILGGSTTAPGTGGEKKASEAELYIMDLASKQLDWHKVLYPGAQEYTDLCYAPNGLVYAVADRKRFFVFDAAKREVIHEEDLDATFGPTTSQQGPRVFVLGDRAKAGAEGSVPALYMLFVKGVAQVDLTTHAITMLAESPVPVGPGGDFLDGRIYFGSGSHVYSYQVPPTAE
ncbi:MAG TPA: hypothetical protein PLO37_18695 [Candidatus Hydrogenedentes bacterium]|nr:hypothetical protein [Candidatus Hydrogenedentota bacterium]HPG68880.1 hypothetical protein [Candidatus Hydrogenedentota bacterium]